MVPDGNYRQKPTQFEEKWMGYAKRSWKIEKFNVCNLEPRVHIFYERVNV